MKKYNFDEMIDRSSHNSLKWDIRNNELPMWVADMDFRTAPGITDAIIKKATQGIYGYSVIPHSWEQAIGKWWLERHSFRIDPQWLVFCTGVVPAISSLVRRLTCTGENVVVQTPVYNIFFNSIVNNGRHILENPLLFCDGCYSIDFEDLERKLSHPETTMLLLCNPHNPVGKIWSREELARVGDLCQRHHVVVVSDEIHCDLTRPGYKYVPFASVSEVCRDISVTCIAPSKTFNMAGMQSAAIIAPNEFLRRRASRGFNTDEVAEPNIFAIDAAVAAYECGGEWLDELRDYLEESRMITAEFLEKNIPEAHLIASDATYLLWIDIRQLTTESERFAAFLRHHTGLWLTAGDHYGNNGKGFLRLNIACPHARLSDGLNRLKKGVEAFKQENNRLS